MIFVKFVHKYCSIVMSIVLFVLLLSGCAVIAPRKELAEPRDIQKKKAMDFFIEGKVAETKENYPQAITSYMEALQYDPESEEIILALATALVNDGKIRSALYFTRLALRINPSNPDSWRMLKYLEQREGRIDKAAEALEVYIKLNPEVKFIDYIQLAWYYLEL
ncbi:tetratricopeptide repeat protein, partial [Candidatus Latescibacterota bacterium]